MSVRVTVITENTAGYSTRLLGEHGLSMMIDASDGSRVLFDTGSGAALLHNMAILGIDPESIDAVILSHGHSDHTGGLELLLAKKQKRLPVFCHPDAFNARFSFRQSADTPKDISIPFSKTKYEELGAVFVLAGGRFVMPNGIIMHSDIPDNPELMFRDEALKTKAGDEYINDPFRDDCSLAIRTDRGLSVLLGCAHKGIINIIEHIAYCENDSELFLTAGGGHLRGASKTYLQSLALMFTKFNVREISMGHCTGFEAAAYLAMEFPGLFHPLYAGYNFTL